MNAAERFLVLLRFSPNSRVSSLRQLPRVLLDRRPPNLPFRGKSHRSDVCRQRKHLRSQTVTSTERFPWGRRSLLKRSIPLLIRSVFQQTSTQPSDIQYVLLNVYPCPNICEVLFLLAISSTLMSPSHRRHNGRFW